MVHDWRVASATRQASSLLLGRPVMVVLQRMTPDVPASLEAFGLSLSRTLTR